MQSTASAVLPPSHYRKTATGHRESKTEGAPSLLIFFINTLQLCQRYDFFVILLLLSFYITPFI